MQYRGDFSKPGAAGGITRDTCRDLTINTNELDGFAEACSRENSGRGSQKRRPVTRRDFILVVCASSISSIELTRVTVAHRPLLPDLSLRKRRLAMKFVWRH